MLGLRECVTERRHEVTPHDIVIGQLGANDNAAHILHEYVVDPAALRMPQRQAGAG